MDVGLYELILRIRLDYSSPRFWDDPKPKKSELDLIVVIALLSPVAFVVFLVSDQKTMFLVCFSSNSQKLPFLLFTKSNQQLTLAVVIKNQKQGKHQNKKTFKPCPLRFLFLGYTGTFDLSIVLVPL